MDKRITFRIREDNTYLMIRKAAQQQGISVSDLIREAVIYYLDRTVANKEDKNNG